MGSWFNSLRKTRERFSGALKGLFASPKPDEATAEELADLLITADVPMRLVQSLSKELERSASRKEPLLSTFQRVLVDALGQNPPLDWVNLICSKYSRSLHYIPKAPGVIRYNTH